MAAQGAMRRERRSRTLMVAVSAVLRVLSLWGKMVMNLFSLPYREACCGRQNSKVLPQFRLLWYMLNYIVIHLGVGASMNLMEHHPYD